MEVIFKYKHLHIKLPLAKVVLGERGPEEHLLCVRGCVGSQKSRNTRFLASGAQDRHLDMRPKQVKSWNEKVTIDSTGHGSEDLKCLLHTKWDMDFQPRRWPRD